MNEKALESRRAALEARRARLTDAQRAVLEQGLAGGLTAPARPACVVPLNEGGAGPLFLVHPAGGDVTCFAPLAKALHRWTVHGLQAPGLAGECVPLESIAAIAAHLVAAARQVQPEGPYRLAGWSLGAQVAFEMAQQLRRAGAEVAFLGLIDGDPEAGAKTRATLAQGAATGSALPWLRGIAQYVEQLWGAAVEVEDLGELSPGAAIERFAARLAQLRGLPGQAPTAAQLQRVVSVYGANLAALKDYQLVPYAGRASLVLGAEPEPWKEAATAQWRALVSQLEVVQTPGDHHTLMKADHAGALAGVLDGLLEERRS